MLVDVLRYPAKTKSCMRHVFPYQRRPKGFLGYGTTNFIRHQLIAKES